MTLQDASQKQAATCTNEDLFTYRDRITGAISTLVEGQEFSAADILAQCRDGYQAEIDKRGIKRGE